MKEMVGVMILGKDTTKLFGKNTIQKPVVVIFLSLLIGIANVAFAQTEKPDDSNGTEETSAPEDRNLRMVVGDSRVLKTEKVVQRLGVGSGEVLQASRVSDQEILINATGAGETNLIVWFDDNVQIEYTIEVFDRSFADRTKQELEQLLAGIDGLKFKSVGASVLIEGKVFSEDEINKIATVVASYDNVINLVTPGEAYRKLLAKEIEKTIAINSVKVRYTKRGYIVEGIVVSEFEAQYAIGIAESFSEKVVNALYIDPNYQQSLPTADVVQLDLKIIEVTKDFLSDFSKDFTVGGSSDFNVSNTGPSTGTATLSIADENLRNLKDNGNGRVIVEQSVIVESTRSADIFVGDEVPIPVTQSGGDNATIEFKQVGIKMNITPSSFSDSTVNLVISAETSAITGEGLGGAPQISIARVSTAAKVKNEENLVFAGLIQHRQTNSFFGSGFNLDKEDEANRLLDDRREVVLMVKPRLLKTSKDSLKDIRRAVERSYKNYEIERIRRLNK